VLRDLETARVLAALLFGAYAARRTSGADRSAAWVTVAATPPGADPERFAPGVDLRGRPGRVDELLSHDELGHAWCTVQPAVDIARGVARTPVRQSVLAGLVTWWSRSCHAPGLLDPEQVADVRDAVAAVRPRLETTPWSGPVEILHTALRDAAAAGHGLLLDLADGASPHGHGAGAAAPRGARRPAPSPATGPATGSPAQSSAGSSGAT
jgi:hypothetical protein